MTSKADHFVFYGFLKTLQNDVTNQHYGKSQAYAGDGNIVDGSGKRVYTTTTDSPGYEIR
jgi:hypothetical protein